MRHRKKRSKLKRNAGHRVALLRNLVEALLRHERINTTLAKAKALRPYAEKMITKAKRGGLHNRRIIARDIHDNDVLKRLFDVYGARYATRPGGYTRILHLVPRKTDGAKMALIELVQSETAAEAAADAKA